MEDAYKIKVKICLVGDAKVGKTSLIRRYVLDVFDDEYITTLGTKVSKKKVIIKHDDKKFEIVLSIWDILGQEDFRNIQNMAFKGSKGTLMVCDITRKDSLMNLQNWITRVKEVTKEIPFIILANKSDLKDQYDFNEEELKDFATGLNMPYYLTSAKTGENVIKTFFQISEMIITKIFERNIEISK
jgi:small GTP-binding protein